MRGLLLLHCAAVVGSRSANVVLPGSSQQKTKPHPLGAAPTDSLLAPAPGRRAAQCLSSIATLLHDTYLPLYMSEVLHMSNTKAGVGAACQ